MLYVCITDGDIGEAYAFPLSRKEIVKDVTFKDIINFNTKFKYTHRVFLLNSSNIPSSDKIVKMGRLYQ